MNIYGEPLEPGAIPDYDDVRPLCIFCGQRFTKAGLGIDAVVPCPDPRTSWGHVEFWRSTREQREARFGPVQSVEDARADFEKRFAAAKPTPEKPIEAKELPPQMGFSL